MRALVTGGAGFIGSHFIRKFKTGDLKNVLNLFSQHMKVAKERKTAFRRRLLVSCISDKPFSLLAEDTFVGSVAENSNGHIIGTVLARRFPFGKSWVIGPMVVHSSFRGSGIAVKMMDFAIRHLKRKKAKWAILSVETSNIQARTFFEKCGFEYLGSIFTDHELARKYVQALTLISGYFTNISHEVEQHPQTETAHLDQSPRTNGIRTWRIMLRRL